MNVSVNRFLKLFLVLSFFALNACNWLPSTGSKPSHVILIAVESLNFEMASCLDDSEDFDGFDELCRDALRFTHFYSTNPMSQSSLATLFTGLEAADHKVLTNGNQGIPYHLTTLAEKAVASGFRTYFFSGGPPILAKSGLHQGFEEFNDDFVRDTRLYKPVRENLQAVLNALVEAPREKTFTGVFIPDLQFSFVGTFSDDGREREKSVNGQKHEVGESLKWFFAELKRNKLWDNSYVFVFGLNGDASASRKNVLWHENLFRENIHMPLFIKMPKGIVLESPSFDSLVSMKDLGLVLNEVIYASNPQTVLNFLSQWKDQAHQYIETRSDWSRAWFNLPIIVAIRTYDYLIFPTKRLQIYHSLVDKVESIPLSSAQVGKENLRWYQYRPNFSIEENALDKNGKQLGGEMSNKDLRAFLEFLHTERQARSSDFLQNLNPKNTSDFSVKVAADRALREKEWAYLEIYLEEIPLPPACERLFYGKQKQRDYRICKDPLFLALLDWERKFGEESGLFLEKSFIRKFRNHIKAKQTAYVNLFLELNWDVNVIDNIGPSLSELYLSLPNKNHLRKKIEEYKIPLYATFPQE